MDSSDHRPEDYRSYTLVRGFDTLESILVKHLRYDHGMKLTDIMARLGMNMKQVKEILGE